MPNDFARRLLSYSAERDDCIGRPERWVSPPELVVHSQLHEEMQAFAKEIWQKCDKTIWTILVGGPGNGKSEAVGGFVRELADLAKAQGLPPPIDAKSGEGGGAINYMFPGQLPHGNVVVLQDASVPRAAGKDPAQDLLETFDLCSDGIHLLACANRGIILRAAREAKLDAKKPWLFDLLGKIDKASGEDATADTAHFPISVSGKDIEVRIWPLDHESCLFGVNVGNSWSDPRGSLLDQIIINAVDSSNWEASGCNECPARDMCPFLADAKWLRDDTARVAFLKLLRHSEVWSDQRLVLREALGLISMVLVGCPSDFVDSGRAVHPCEWVISRVQGSPSRPASLKALIELASHRIYNDLFCRQLPAGLALDKSNQRRDLWVTKRLNSMGQLGQEAASAIRQLDREFAKQSGPLRLVGSDGILKHFDPAKDSGWCAQHALSCDGDIAEYCSISIPLKSNIELCLDSEFLNLETAAKHLPAHEDTSKIFAAIYRWASSHYLRLVGAARGVSLHAESIEAFLHLLKNPNEPVQFFGKTILLKELLREIAQSTNGNYVELAPSFFAHIDSFKPKLVGARGRSAYPNSWPANDRLVVKVAQSNSASIIVVLAAKVFSEACRCQSLRLARWTMLPNVDSVVRTWMGDYLVSQGQYKSREAIEHRGDPALIFEAEDSGELRVRSQ
jgi:hypothetical protein